MISSLSHLYRAQIISGLADETTDLISSRPREPSDCISYCKKKSKELSGSIRQATATETQLVTQDCKLLGLYQKSWK